MLNHLQSIGKKLREARKDQGLSLRDLASQAEVSASLLSQIENNRSNPSVRTLYNLAAVLSLPLDDFFTDDADTRASTGAPVVEKTASEMRSSRSEGKVDGEFAVEVEGQILHEADRPSIELLGGVTWSRLTPHAEEGFEILEIHYEAGAASGTARSHHSGREFGIVLEGNLKVELRFEEYEMGPGDSTIFESSVPHRLSNSGDEPVRAIWVVMDSP